VDKRRWLIPAALIGALVAGVTIAVTAAGVTAKEEKAAGGSPAASSSDSASATPSPAKPSPRGSPSPKSTLIGDGSTSNTGPQPNRRTFPKLEEGKAPPQFVVFSWDGAGEGTNGLLKHFTDLGTKHDARMTFFLTGIYMLPKDKASNYQPPQRAAGASDIGYLSDEGVRMTIKGIGDTWRAGHEIGTHFNGHFCGKTGGGSWSVADWTQEINESKKFVKEWRTLTGWTDLPSLPFDYDQELIGGRAPCLEGQTNLIEAQKPLGFRYDSSGSRPAIWPSKTANGTWDLSMTMVPFTGAGRKGQIIPMDYNFMVNQSKKATQGDPAMFGTWKTEVKDSLRAGIKRSQSGNRAPIFIGNHFNGWNGGIYMDAITELVAELDADQDIQMVSFRELVDWLDAQDPALLERLQQVPIGSSGVLPVTPPPAAATPAASPSPSRS
jgi:hypothetical protein